jgi:hypothetical protein
MIMQEEVNDIDRVVVLDDLSRGDMVYIDSVLSKVKRTEFGIIKESGEGKLVVETWEGVFTFDTASEPVLSLVLAKIRRIPNFDKIESGIILSRIIDDDDGTFSREYAKAVHVHRKGGAFNSITVEFLNGMLKGKRRTYSPDTTTITEQMAGWEIED